VSSAVGYRSCSKAAGGSIYHQESSCCRTSGSNSHPWRKGRVEATPSSSEGRGCRQAIDRLRGHVEQSKEASSEALHESAGLSEVKTR
jgi:hypothetical protein